jgi:hypothetical protein
MNTCGQCNAAKPIPGDPKHRTCMGDRPQIIVVPQQMPNGKTMAAVQTCFPQVAANQEAPRCFVPGVYGEEFFPAWRTTRLANDPDNPR